LQDYDQVDFLEKIVKGCCKNCGNTLKIVTKEIYKEKLWWEYKYGNDGIGEGTEYFFTKFMFDDGKITNIKSHNFFTESSVPIPKEGKVDIDDIIKLIEFSLETAGFICVTLNNHDHCFLLSETEKGLMIVDSYLNLRPASIRPFDLNDFKKFLETQDDALYEKMFLTSKTGQNKFRIKISL